MWPFKKKEPPKKTKPDPKFKVVNRYEEVPELMCNIFIYLKDGSTRHSKVTINSYNQTLDYYSLITGNKVVGGYYSYDDEVEILNCLRSKPIVKIPEEFCLDKNHEISNINLNDKEVKFKNPEGQFIQLATTEVKEIIKHLPIPTGKQLKVLYQELEPV